jgi:hypothetical protein
MFYSFLVAAHAAGTTTTWKQLKYYPGAGGEHATTVRQDPALKVPEQCAFSLQAVKHSLITSLPAEGTATYQFTEIPSPSWLGASIALEASS